MSKVCMLTTIDNPFNPFKDFDSWFMFDTEKGYNSCGRMMRLAKLEEENLEVERAIDEIIKLDITDTYKKVVKE
mgnify:CR=1 FL=1